MRLNKLDFSNHIMDTVMALHPQNIEELELLAVTMHEAIEDVMLDYATESREIDVEEYEIQY